MTAQNVNQFKNHLDKYWKSTILPQYSIVKLKFHGIDMDTDTDFLADFRARMLADLSRDFCPTHAFPREDVR